MKKFYVYTLAYPNGTVFYVGKGQGNRIDQHEQEALRGEISPRHNVIRQIWGEGGEVIKQVFDRFDVEEDACIMEEALISYFDKGQLANARAVRPRTKLPQIVEEHLQKRIQQWYSFFAILEEFDIKLYERTDSHGWCSGSRDKGEDGFASLADALRAALAWRIEQR